MPTADAAADPTGDPSDGSSAPPPTCFFHADRETGRVCTRCNRPACGECLHPAPVGSHCWQCIKAAQPPLPERLRRWNAGAGGIATNVILAVNAAVFVVIIAQGGLGGRVGAVARNLALFGPSVADGEWYRLVTSGFVHYGVIHLGFNMMLLYRFGQMLESAIGRTRFVGLYLACLLTGSLGAVALSPLALTGGASGALFGLIGAAAVGMQRRGISVWDSGLGGLIVINLIFTFAVPNISIGGHLGGLAGGAALGAFLFRRTPSPRALLEDLVVTGAVAIAATGAAVWVASHPF